MWLTLGDERHFDVAKDLVHCRSGRMDGIDKGSPFSSSGGAEKMMLMIIGSRDHQTTYTHIRWQDGMAVCNGTVKLCKLNTDVLKTLGWAAP